MPRQSPDNTPDRDEAPSDKGFFERVAAWLDSNNLEYADHPDRQFFSLRYTGDHGDWRVIIDVGEGSNGRRLLVYSIYPVRVPEGMRATVSELITRINYGLQIGSFEMDWSDGELRIRTAMPLEKGDFTDMQLEHIFYGNLALANRYLAGIYGSAFGNVTPEVALEMAQVSCKDSLQ